MNTTKRKVFQGLTIVKLDTDLSHAVSAGVARVFFQLSEPPPLGWSYMFTTVWEALNYPMKGNAAVDIDTGALWIECVPEEVATHHIGYLEEAVARTNATYCGRIRQQAFMASRRAQSIAEFRTRLEEVGRTLYPEDVPVDECDQPEQSWDSGFLAGIKRAIFKIREKFWSVAA